MKRPLFTAVLVFIVALCPRSSFAFPVYLTSNGTTLVNSAFGSNVVLGPDAGGQVLASALLNATNGIALNSTLLNEPLVQSLISSVSLLTAQLTAQQSSIATLTSRLNNVTPPSCGPPGGDRLTFVNGSWVCVCKEGFTANDCSIPFWLDTIAGVNNVCARTDGATLSANFGNPTALTQKNGVVLVADTGNSVVRVLSNGTVTTLTAAYGPSCSWCGMCLPRGVVMDPSGNIYVLNNGVNGLTGACSIVSASLNATKVALVAGADPLAAYPSFCAYQDGVGSAARFSNPQGLALDVNSTGMSDAILYVADSGNHRIRRVVVSTGVVTTLAGCNTRGFVDGSGTSACFNTPVSVAQDPTDGSLIVADQSNCALRRVYQNGSVITLGGLPPGVPPITVCSSVDGVLSANPSLLPTASFDNTMLSVLVGSRGQIFITSASGVVRYYDPVTMMVTTLAGTPGVGGASSGVGATAYLRSPSGLAFGTNNTILVSDQSSCVIRTLYNLTTLM